MKGCEFMLVRKDKKKSHSGGFIGAATSTKKTPYTQTPRDESMYPLGSESNFIVPASQEARDNCPRGIKR